MDRDERDPTFAFTGHALGSALRLHVRVPRPVGPAFGASSPAGTVAEAAWDAVRAEFASVDLALSRFRPDSELMALNRQAGSGRVVDVSWRLRTALASVHRASRVTGGRFDASVLGTLERIGEHGAPLAVDTGRLAAGPALEDHAVLVDGPVSRVVVPDAPLDMGGIGKGLALRWAAAAALRELPDGAGLLLEAGGDVVHAGVPPADGWLVGIDDPVAEPGPGTEPLSVVTVRAGAVATSSIAVRNWFDPDGRGVHHIVDPATDAPARTGLIAVTVAGPDPAWAEVWTKALFLAGRGSIGEEARARGIATWWVDDRGRLGMTPEARVRSAWVAEARVG
jgi:FAD:protein FMN transferase